jgi:membrane-associated protein
VQVASLLVATSTSSTAGNWWEYILLLLAVMTSWAGVPAIGSAAVGAAAVGASQDNLNIIAVLVIAVIGGELGGLVGFKIGTRWGTQLLDRPGKRQAGRRKLMEKGELAYAKWGRLAVFFTPAIISGTARMKFSQFALWNLLASFAFSVSVAATAYGAGRVATGHHSAKDITILIIGFVTGLFLTVLIVRRHRRHRSLTMRTVI